MVNLPPPTPIYRLSEQRPSDIVKNRDPKASLVSDSATEVIGIARYEEHKKLKSLSFACQKLDFYWNQDIPVNVEVDGLLVQSMIFNKKKLSILKNIEFGTKATVTVTNKANYVRNPGFAIAVFDAENRLLGVASGGPKIGGIQPGTSTTFNLTFDNVIERITKGSYFYFSVELAS